MPERRCEGCTKQEEWGCFAVKLRDADPARGVEAQWYKPAYMPLTFENEEWFACPRQPIRENPKFWSKLFLYYGMYKKGFLPEKGAIVDQSNKLIQMFLILDMVNHECDAYQEEQARKKKGNPRNRGNPRSS